MFFLRQPTTKRDSSLSGRGHDLIPSLNGLRALSVMIVLVSHVGFGDIIPGGFGVTAFFFLSGYLITTLLLQESVETGKIIILNFYLRRLLRLGPPLLITLVIAYTLTWSGLLPGGISIRGFLAQLFYFSNYYSLFYDPGNTLPNGTAIFWSLAVEEHFYILYPAIMISALAVQLRPRGIALMLAAACVVVLLWRVHLVHSTNFVAARTYYASDTRIDSIAYGCILALAFNPVSWRDGLSMAGSVAKMTFGDWSLLIAALGLLAVTMLVRGEVFRETLRYSLQGVALMPVFFYSIRHADKFPFKFFNRAAISTLGVYSYAIYLIHFVIIDLTRANAPEVASNRIALFVIAFGLAVGFAAAIDRWVDPYFRMLRRRLHVSATATVPALSTT